MREVYYEGNVQETYTLCVDDSDVAEILTGEDGAMEITNIVRNFFDTYKNCALLAYNDNDKLGIIMDAYQDDELVASETIWFDDFRD